MTITKAQIMRTYEEAAYQCYVWERNKKEGLKESASYSEVQYRGMLRILDGLGLLDDYAEWHEKNKDHYTL